MILQAVMQLLSAWFYKAVTEFWITKQDDKNDAHTVAFKEFDIYLARFSKVFSPLNQQQTHHVSQEMTQSLVKL